jgi:hypothetical protein
MPIISALGRERQEELEFSSNLGYIARLSQNKQTKNTFCRVQVLHTYS